MSSGQRARRVKEGGCAMLLQTPSVRLEESERQTADSKVRHTGRGRPTASCPSEQPCGVRVQDLALSASDVAAASSGQRGRSCPNTSRPSAGEHSQHRLHRRYPWAMPSTTPSARWSQYAVNLWFRQVRLGAPGHPPLPEPWDEARRTLCLSHHRTEVMLPSSRAQGCWLGERI